MSWTYIKKLMSIWALPLIALQCFVVVASLVFQELTQHPWFQGEAYWNLDAIFGYTLAGATVITCWLIIWRYEKAEAKTLRKIRIGVKVYTVIYFISLAITLGLKAVFRNLEAIIGYTLGGAIVITCWLIVWRFERAEAKPVRKSIRTSVRVFTIMYFISLVITLSVWAILYLLYLLGYLQST